MKTSQNKNLGFSPLALATLLATRHSRTAASRALQSRILSSIDAMATIESWLMSANVDHSPKY